MSSVPYSRYLFYPVPWYSVLIVIGAVLAVFLACREERRCGLPKDTFIDLALWLLPFGIIGARIYYVVFSWNQFRDDPVSMFRIWEGGIAIYGGVIAGLVVLLVFARRRKLSPLLLCDAIAPGLALAQGIGRWGNWFNIEAYGLELTGTPFCFFPLAVQVPAAGYTWHMATFFYESVWDVSVFLFLILARRRFLRKSGDVFFFYVLLYAAGRLVIEELRMDSLYAASSVRVSQLLSVLLCMGVLLRYVLAARKAGTLSRTLNLFLVLPAAFSVLALAYALTFDFFSSWSALHVILVLSAYSLLMILSLFLVYHAVPWEVRHADDEA